MSSDVVIASTGCSPRSFGAALAAHGDELLVGSPFRDYLDVADEGIAPPVACLLRRAGGAWSLVQRLVAPAPRLAEGFGRQVTLGATFAIVGAPGNENGDGATHDFARALGSAAQLRVEALWPPGDDESFAEFGVAVAADDDVLLVGAPLDMNGCEGGGAVHVYDRRAPSPRPITTLRGSRPREGFGSALALSGDRLVVGAWGAFSNEQLAGAAYVFHRDAIDRWREIARISGTRAGEEMGHSVAIDGDRIAVGAPGRADRGLPPGGGHVRVYEMRGNRCDPMATLADASGFGSSVALRGDRLVVGQPMYTAPSGVVQTGRAGLWRVRGGALAHEGWIERASAAPYARVGSAVALGDDFVAAGAPGLGDEEGSAS